MTTTPESSLETEPAADSPPALRVVRPVEAAVPGENPTETTGPVPVLDRHGAPVAPKPPWDARLMDGLQNTVRGVPRFGREIPSLADSLEYSQRGDWAQNPNGVKRAVHGLATLVAFAVTYPLVDVLGQARTKPGPFTVGVLIVLTGISTFIALLAH